MKIYIILLSLIFLYSCKEHSSQPIIPKDCSLPIQFTQQNVDHVPGYFANKASPDGSQLLFSYEGVEDLNLLDLKTLNVTKIDFRNCLPKNMKIDNAGGVQYWCPYDNSIFVAICIIYIDTVGDGKNFISGNHLIKTNIAGTYFEDICPKTFGPLGQPIILSCDGWLPTSKQGSDTFLLAYEPNYHSSKYVKYCPQTQYLQDVERTGISTYSYDGKYYYRMISDFTLNNLDNTRFYINQSEITYKDENNAFCRGGHFSLDGKKFAISANITDTLPNDKKRLSEIWILDVDKFMLNPINPALLKIINLKENFCMFTYAADAVFISNNTLAVNMFNAGDKFSNLWEIDTNGNLIRQLTFHQ